MLRKLFHQLRASMRRRKAERELDAEMRFHLEMETAENIRRGMNEEEARLAALRSFGGVEKQKEAYRDVRRLRWIEELWQDVRYGARILLKQPGFALIAVLSLALGIGANTAIFSVVDEILLRPLPYHDAERLVLVAESWPARNLPQLGVDPDTFADWQEQNRVFSEMALYDTGQAVLAGDGEPEKVPSQFVTANLFKLLGVGASLGRDFTPDDIKPDQPRVIVISHSLWQRRYGGDPSVIGRRLRLTLAFPEEATIVGIMPPGFQWRTKIGDKAELWTTFSGRYGLTRGHRVWQGRRPPAVARLKPGVSLARAKAEMATIEARIANQYPNRHAELTVSLTPLREQLYGGLRLTLLVLFGAVTFILLIVCANVANLLLARAAARGREIALRSALGASPPRILRQLLTESLLLALMGGFLGLLGATWGAKLLFSMSPPDLIRLQNVRLNTPVLIFTLIISLATSVFIGIMPACVSSRMNLHDTLKEGGRSVGDNRKNRRLRGLFVIVEVALALVLLAGAGLLINSFARLRAVDPGFNPQNVLTMEVSQTGNWQLPERQRIDFIKQAVERLQALPGVRSAGAVSDLPFAGPAGGVLFNIEDRPKPPPGGELVTRVCVTDTFYFAALQIPLRRGRFYTEGEATEAHGVVLINESLARKYFPNEDPIGKRVTVHSRPPSHNPPVEIIGIVGDIKQETLDGTAEPTFYWPHSELALPSLTLVIRTEGDPFNVAAAARGVIRSLAPDEPVARVRTLESYLAESLGRARFNTILLSVFAFMALILSSIGIYGVMAYAVTQRTQEIGIRMALGAQARDVLKIVIAQGMKLALIGIAIGLLAAFALTRWMETLLFGVRPADPATFIVITALLGMVALAACWIPARRATKMDPLAALRSE
jgi:putative ABC transport system permease protein